MSLENSPHWSSTWLRELAAGKFLGGVSTSTLAKWRLSGSGPPFSKAGRIVVYNCKDFDTYLVSRRCRSTSEDAS